MEGEGVLLKLMETLEMAWPSLHIRAPEPQAARDLIRKGHPVLGFSLSLIWLLGQIIGTLAFVAVSVWLATQSPRLMNPAKAAVEAEVRR